MAEVTINQLVKKFGATTIIKGVNLKITDGEFAIFVGPSGCGKSTILRMIAGLESITSGEITIGSALVNDLPPVKRGISMVFQSYALYPHLTVYENIAFPLRVARMQKTEIDRRVAYAARVLKLEERLQHKPGTLSGGQRQRVAIGRSIVREPKVFLFDEPLSNLDAALRAEMRIELAQLHKTLGNTMIYVTHDQIEAMTMADKIIVLREGNIEQIGSPLELYYKPNNQFVAGFIGNPTMNFLDVEFVNASKQGINIIIAGQKICLPVKERPVTKLARGTKLQLGVRPEHINLGQNEIKFDIAVNLVELLGLSTIIYGKVQGEDNRTLRVVLANSVSVSAKTSLTIGFNAQDCHLFAPDELAFERKRSIDEFTILPEQFA